MKRTLLGVLLVVAGCEGKTGGPSPDMVTGGGTGGGMTATGGGDSSSCEHAATDVVPLYLPGPSESGPIIITRADGVIVTNGAGRVRPRHEREDRFMHYEAHYFQSRSYRFVIEDFTPLGQSKIKVTYYPVDDPSQFGPTTNFRAWKVYGPQGNGADFYTFADNGTLTQTAPRVLEKTTTRNARDNRDIRVGDIFDFEFGIFLAGFNGQDPTSIGEGAKSYYSDTFRYQVGVGGLSPETYDTTGLVGPTAKTARLGGGLSVPHIAYADGTPVAPELAFSQLALNVQGPHQQTFLEGRRLFHTEFDSGEHTEPYNPIFTEQKNKLGPLFNVSSCSACHQHNGRGVLPDVGGTVDSVVLKLPAASQFGVQLQPQEAKVTLASFETHDVTLADGTVVTLKKPVFTTGQTLQTSPRIARQLVGVGLLEALDESAVLAKADPQDCDGNGISGRAQLVADPVSGERRLGRFGWKAAKISVRHQVAEALDLDMGVTTSIFPGNAIELDDADLNRVTTYMQLLGVLPQRNSNDAKVQKGETLFAGIGCSQCHVMSATTGTTHPFEELRAQTIRPFTDLLLHDLGENLKDDSGSEDASEWRTPPLWGVGYTQQTAGKVNLLHDGRAGSVLEAVLWHGGEAQPMRDAVTRLAKDDRDALIAFLESL